MIIYIVKLSGYENGPFPDEWKPYLKDLSGSSVVTTSNPATAKIWIRKESAQRNAERLENFLKNIPNPLPNIKAEVVEVEFNIKS